ncbi:hypothetical protein F5887DRAFT_1287930, partial [Amanita rubescens]
MDSHHPRSDAVDFKTRSNANCQFRATLHTTRAASSELLSKKLLVLDLNGTLLFRPKRSPLPHSGPSRGRFERPVFRRPFMRTLCKYLFHQETRSWFDTMVWSSAQPHNVATMVQSCFMNEQEKLVLVWGRDHMDLDTDSYNKDVPTMKNLETVWNYFKIKPNHRYLRILRTTRFWQYDSKKCRSDLAAAVFPPNAPNVLYDVTLLALIGILEELKNEPNVPKWIQNAELFLVIWPLIVTNQLQLRRCVVRRQDIEHHWAEKGKIIADRLGIDVEAGVSRT